jgi:hypothetical protein
MNLCGLSQAPVELPDAGHGCCCWGTVMRGPSGCTCWELIYDLEQVEPDPKAVAWLAAGIQPVTRSRPCEDCAYRADSPERQGSEDVSGDQALLDRIVAEGSRFWCHQGIRRPVAWRHPSGAEIPGSPSDYRPPIVDGVPYRADGTAAEVCAGWAARRRALEQARGTTE